MNDIYIFNKNEYSLMINKSTIYFFIKKIIIFLNLNYFFINIFFFLLPKKEKLLINKILSGFKNADKININLFSKSYSFIANYLNDKYLKNPIKHKIIEKKNLKKNNKKKIIKLYFSKILLKEIKNLFILCLKDKFIIKISQDNPDYLIYNVFGKNKLFKKYNDTIKIAFYSENKIIDFNKADYAIGHSHINYLDRYFKFSIFFFKKLKLLNIKKIIDIRKKNILNSKREKFCVGVISNLRSTDFFRINFIKELNKYKKVDMGGAYNNNVGGPIQNKIKFLSSYKFSIAMENTNGDGYNSEKIIESLISGTIPIYYGDYMIEEFINPKTYILILGQKDIKDKIKYIKKIDNDDKLYKSILMENLLINENLIEKVEKELIEFISHIFEQEKNKAKRITNYN